MVGWGWAEWMGECISGGMVGMGWEWEWEVEGEIGFPGGVPRGFRVFPRVGSGVSASDQEDARGPGAVEGQNRVHGFLAGWEWEWAREGGFRVGFPRGFQGFPGVSGGFRGVPPCASDQEYARGLGAVESQNLVRGFLAVLLSLL